MRTGTVAVRLARPGEVGAVIDLLDRAMLQFDRSELPERIRHGSVVVITDGEKIHGTAVLGGHHIEAIAIAKAWRGKGLGRAIIEAIQRRTEVITASCHPQALGFYRALGFTCYSLPDGQCFAYRSDQTSGSTSS